MDNQPSFDRSLLLPIIIGAFSIFGILIILLIGRVNASPASVSEEPTETPFKYIYLGTEPLPSVEGTISPESELSTETPFGGDAETPQPPVASTPTLGTPNLTGAATTNSPRGTVASPTRAAIVIYDDIDSRLAYTGSWIPQTNVTGAYQGTLHISNTVNDAVVFLLPFPSDRVRFSYQAGPSLGTVTVTINTLEYPPISQASSTTEIVEWESGPLVIGNHEVVITHSGGGSINIDSVAIPQSISGTATSTTPTVTPTRTPTGTPP